MMLGLADVACNYPPGATPAVASGGSMIGYPTCSYYDSTGKLVEPGVSIQLPTVPVPVSNPAPPTAIGPAGPQVLTQAQIDANVALAVAMAAQTIPNADASSITQICGECANPTAALTQWLLSANAQLPAGMTPSQAIGNYGSQIAEVCQSAAAHAKALGITTPCTPPSSGSGLSTTATVLIAAGVLALIGLSGGNN